MANIPRAFNILVNKEMSVAEYDEFIKNYPNRESINPLRCTECNDVIIYCKGDFNKPYFKHIPTSESHLYCSLYTQGKQSFSSEAKLRRRLICEEGLFLNFELVYFDGIWKCFLTLPPFTDKEIEDFEIRKTRIIINSGKTEK